MALRIRGKFTCDNSYSVWLGNPQGVHTQLLGAQSNLQAAEIRDGEDVPEFSAAPDDYLYIIAWSDDATFQGLLGSFTGDITIHTGDPRWRVLPAGRFSKLPDFKPPAPNFGDLPANPTAGVDYPSQAQINSVIAAAGPGDWLDPYVGPKNIQSEVSALWNFQVSGVAPEAQWVWHDSGKNPNVSPLLGFNHDEFLIFRIPCAAFSKSCGCCDGALAAANEAMAANVKGKFFVVEESRKGSLEVPEAQRCASASLPSLAPRFHLRWGDGQRDQIETHDDEVLYITAENPWNNIAFKGVVLTSIRLVDSNGNPPPALPDGGPSAYLCPSTGLLFGDLAPCPGAGSRVTRDLALVTRGVSPGTWKIQFEWCGSVVLCESHESAFKLEIVLS